MEGQLEQITQTLIDAALDGDLAAIRLILERLVPPCKEKALPQLNLPPVTDASSLPKLTAAILGAVADGRITPGEGQALAALANTHDLGFPVHATRGAGEDGPHLARAGL